MPHTLLSAPCRPSPVLPQALLGAAREGRDGMMRSLRERDPDFAAALDAAAAQEAEAGARAAAEGDAAREAAARREAEAGARAVRVPCPDCGGYHSDDE